MRPDSCAPYGPVQEVGWSPISFGRSDVRRRHMPAFRRGASSAYLVALIADQGQALPSPPRTLVGQYSLLAGRYARGLQFKHEIDYMLTK